MEIKLDKIKEIDNSSDLLILVENIDGLKSYGLNEVEINFAETTAVDKNFLVPVNRYTNWIFIQLIPSDKKDNELLEWLRREASKLKPMLNRYKISNLQLSFMGGNEEILLAYTEGILLSHYSFLKYFENKEEKSNSLKNLSLHCKALKPEKMEELAVVSEYVCHARRLVNEPLSYLNTQKLSEEIVELSILAGFAVEMLGKKQIESLRMGGLLAVNQGSANPPAFSILSWKPEKPRNKKPIILIGKGIVYDTGGLSLKPTPDSMDYMKCDMAGAAAVACTIGVIAKLNLPVNIIGLIPAAENLVSNTAYVPGDVIKMHNKKTVEVLNTDAEGRLILADALSYASKYKPELVIDLATLTGAAAVALGHYGMVVTGTASDKIFESLENSSNKTCERFVRFPLWEDYKELLKSDIADIKNIGGRTAGAITAGKFLEFFTDFPWIHFDIAGPAWVSKDFHYLTKGGTGFGVRLLVDFIKNYIN
ncbi:MAG: leucyl aminopeptidase [Bacteroidales bacterium]